MKYMLNHFYQLYMAEAILGNNQCQQNNGNVVLNLHLLEIMFTLNCGGLFHLSTYFQVSGVALLFDTTYKIVLAKCFQDTETW